MFTIASKYLITPRAPRNLQGGLQGYRSCRREQQGITAVGEIARPGRKGVGAGQNFTGRNGIALAAIVRTG